MVAKQTTSVTDSSAANRASSPRARTGAASGARPVGGERRVAAPSLLTFFQESRSELRKVAWPTRQDVTNLTLAVIGMTVGIALFLGLIDEILNLLIKPIIGAQ